MALTIREIEDARRRIAPYVVRTPLLRLNSLDAYLGCQVFVKAECMQITGAFKLRGAMNKILSLPEEERRRGIVAASSGNHGKAVAYACRKLGIPATIVLPYTVAKIKKDTIERWGAETVLCDVAERANVDLAFENLRAPEYLYEFMRRVDSPRVGVCFDAGHNHFCCPERNILKDFSDRIKAVHLHDNFGDFDAHNIPGDGSIDWKALRKELIESAYTGAWSLEIEHAQTSEFGKALLEKDKDPYFGMGPEEYLARAFNAHQKLINGEL